MPSTASSASITLPSSVSAVDSETRWANTSVSVSLASSMPWPVRRARNAAALSMMPLCTTATVPLMSVCGCAFTSVAGPCVAHRVWPMPTRPDIRLGSTSARSRTRPARLVTLSWEPTTATPAESYPRCSSLPSASTSRGAAFWPPM